VTRCYTETICIYACLKNNQVLKKDRDGKENSFSSLHQEHQQIWQMDIYLTNVRINQAIEAMRTRTRYDLNFIMFFWICQSKDT